MKAPSEHELPQASLVAATWHIPRAAQKGHEKCSRRWRMSGDLHKRRGVNASSTSILPSPKLQNANDHRRVMKERTVL
jgi:hypothetical protein